jgi:hypothetical protein
MQAVSSLTLTADLNCPSLPASGAALLILKSGVRVDLNGRTIEDGFSSGNASGWSVGDHPLLNAGSGNIVTSNRATNNGAGIVVTAVSPGIPAVSATNAVISGNTVLHNASAGIMLFGENLTGMTVIDNVAIANGHAEKTGWTPQCRSGIRAQGTGHTLIGNTAYDNVAYGLHVEAKDLKAQFGNRAARNGEATGCIGVTCQ